MKVYLPSDNPITQGYSSSHRGYDYSGLNRPDEVRCGADGEIIERVDEYDTNWINTGTLTTKDYGNYIKVKHNDGSYALFAHLKKGSSFLKGIKVTASQTIARIGNTGNSTGKHLHAEYRNSSNVNQQAEFYTNIEIPQPTPIITDQTIIDLGKYGKMEVQQIRGKLSDLEIAQKQVKELELSSSKLAEDLKNCQQNLSNPPNSADSLTFSELFRLLVKKFFA
jgi:murein DD-endopeptidase MepM/ murein hydrolase activator NlpD